MTGIRMRPDSRRVFDPQGQLGKRNALGKAIEKSPRLHIRLDEPALDA
jgi:hypothetical protein